MNRNLLAGLALAGLPGFAGIFEALHQETEDLATMLPSKDLTTILHNSARPSAPAFPATGPLTHKL